MTEHIEVVACPKCGKDIAVTLEWDAGEAPSRDCPGARARWDVLDYTHDGVACVLGSWELDIIDDNAKKAATYTMQEQQREAAR